MTEHDHAALNQIADAMLVLAAENRTLKAELDASRKRNLGLIEALKYIEGNRCCGTYGPCGAADQSANVAEDALEQECSE